MRSDRIRIWLLGLGAAAQVGCGAPLDAGSDVVKTSEALSASDVCSLINTLGSMDLGLPVTVSAQCPTRQASELTYVGSTPSIFSAVKSSQVAERSALYCALLEANGAFANALISTGFGSFGMLNRFYVPKSDPSKLTLSGERYAALTAFGLSLFLETQDFDWANRTEQQLPLVITRTGGTAPFTETLPSAVGFYNSINTTGYPWAIDASANFPIGVINTTISIDFHSMYNNILGRNIDNLAFNGGDARAYAIQPTGTAQDTARRNSFWSHFGQCGVCPAGQPCLSPCPTTTDFNQLFRPCVPVGPAFDNCNDAYYATLNDGRVPHTDRIGAAGPGFYDTGTVNDWWHIGKPGVGARGSAIQPLEPAYNMATHGTTDATTDLQIGLGFSYDAGVASIGLNIGMDAAIRGGAALREHFVGADRGPQPVAVDLGIDAEASAAVNAELVVVLDLPFGGNTTVLDETFTLLSRRTAQSATNIASSVSWGLADGDGIQSFNFPLHPTDTVTSCLASPAVNNPPVTITDPGTFVKQLKNQIQTELFPCNIRICGAAPGGGSTGRLTTCSWNAPTKNLTCATTTTPCVCGATGVDLCDARGNVYKGTPRNTIPACPAPPPG